jgi:hypothetical protein
MSFAEWGQNNEGSFKNVWFSDEAHFHLDGVVNRFYRALTMVYNTQNYWVFGLCPSS